MSKKIQNFLLFLLIFICIGGIVLGAEIIKHKIKNQQKIEIVKTVEKEKVLEIDNKELLDEEIDKISKEYGIRKEVFYAIEKCEGGYFWALNSTKDGGNFQLNLKTADFYAKRVFNDEYDSKKILKYVLDPRYSVKLTAEIIKAEGLKPWVTKDCIVRELIFNNNNNK